MRMAIQANVRAASAARRGFNESLSIAYYAGTITGMLTDGLGLFGGTLIFIVFGTAAPDALLGFGFGGTLLALFMRVGGGIFTKAADVGADLVGKVEKDIPEDDPRNAAVVADLVGDNVGDCAGMAADIFESYEVTIVSALILGLALMALDPTHALKWIVYPLIIRAIGVISSILGTFTVPIWERFPIKFLRAKDAEEAMFRSYEVSSVNTVFWSFVVAVYYAHDWRLAMLTSVGVGLAVAFNPLTSYFTSTRKSPVKEIVKSTKTGPATTILSGLAVGMESSVWAVVIICISFIVALALYSAAGALYVLYGVAMIGIGMLSHTGNNVAMDSYGPISDNANGIAEMSWHGQCDEETVKARQIMADLDAVGNTTKAITKGVAIASAVIAAVSLFASYITDVGRVQIQLGIQNVMTSIRLSETKVFVGLLLRRRPALALQLAVAPGRHPGGRAHRRGGPAAVQAPGDHGRQGQAGLRPGRRDLDGRGPEGARAAGPDLGLHAAHRRPGPPGRGPGRVPGGDHPERPAPGRLHGQRGRRLGQRQEIASRTSPRTSSPAPGRARTGTRRASSATRSAIRSRTRPGRPSTR
ncbi:MAG: sodium/proton-translocating pyrophosphatase [Sphingobacterium sp.]|nr:sodium/proton-translocating pyrophosphatase [Sphingobacterium sp.]